MKNLYIILFYYKSLPESILVTEWGLPSPTTSDNNSDFHAAHFSICVVLLPLLHSERSGWFLAIVWLFLPLDFWCAQLQLCVRCFPTKQQLYCFFFFSSVVDTLVTGMQPSWNEVLEIYFNLRGDHEGWPCICIRQFVFSYTIVFYYPLPTWLYLPDGNQLPLNVCDFTQLLFSILVFSRQKVHYILA